MAETISTTTVVAETQIHITNINIACPINNDMSATVRFDKASVNPSDGTILLHEQWDSNTDGHHQISLDQNKIIELLGEELLNNLKTNLHAIRKADLPSDSQG
jgi:hypothetical protein